jgi:hypothetical protein
MMTRTLSLAVASALLLAIAGRGHPPLVSPAWAACDPGDKLDKTTLEETRQKLQKAGYKSIHDLRKGCDNTWHGKASKDGAEASVVVLPDGTIVTESPD